MPHHVRIFDTTLRDGEQAPGNSLDATQKLRFARQLQQLGVDVIEAGFPAASPEDFAGVQQIARSVEGPVIAAMARCHAGDIDAAAAAVREAPRGRVHIVFPTSDLHLEHKLGIDRAEALRCVQAGVARAMALRVEVEFCAEDASRSDREFLCEAVGVAVREGATVINLPDTVGYALPDEYAALFRLVLDQVPATRELTLSAHCHDDLGLATANTLAAIAAGARQAECTINGIGERAGNAALEEIVMAGRVRRGDLGFTTAVDSTALTATSRLLSELTGVAPQPNKAIVGRNAFAHESGIHQHAILRHPGTYEIMSPSDVGLAASAMVLGRHSGRAALAHRMEALGYVVDAPRLDLVYQAFLRLTVSQRTVEDADLHRLVDRAVGRSSVGHTFTAGPQRLAC